MEHPLEPSFIAEGPMAGQGTGDRQMPLLMATMPRFQHRIVKTSFARIFHDMGQQDGICTHLVLKNAERETFAVFTERPTRGYHYRLMMREEDLPKFAPFQSRDGQIDLTALSETTPLRGSYVAARALPDIISQALQSAKSAPEIAQSPNQAVQLLRAGRVDFIIAQPVEIRFAARQTPTPMLDVPLKGIPRFVSGYTACSDGPIGRAMIAAIDEAHRDQAQWETFIAPFKGVYSAEEIAESLASRPEPK
jgi:uncharacterized protein (TIGR02285 family)